MDLDRIREIQRRNREAMERENAAKEAERQRVADARDRAIRGFPAMMVKAVDLVTTCPGRPLTAGQMARLREIRLRNQILAEVERLSGAQK